MKIVLKIKADPRNFFISSPSDPQQAIPIGSVIKHTTTKQKFVKKNGDHFSYAAIQITPPTSWKWDLTGEESWKMLQDLYAETTPNSIPTGLSLSSLSAQENQTLVGTLSAIDADIGDTLTYSIVSGYADGSSFIITSGNELRFITAPDYEVKNQYTLKVRATDTDNAFVEEQYVISISDVVENNPPTLASLGRTIVLENETTVGTLSATDADINDVHVFAISGGVDADSFEIENSYNLRLKNPANYSLKTSYAVQITATDSAGATKTEDFIINVKSRPTSVQLSNSTIAEENQLNQIIGTLSGTSPDGNQLFSYSLIGGDTINFNIQGNTLRANSVFDYEVKSSYTITVRATDIHGQYVDSIFPITIQQSIININENMENDYGIFKFYNSSSQYGLKNVVDLTPYPSVGKIQFIIENYRNSKSKPYGSFWAMLEYTKNENSYTFNWLGGPVKNSRTMDEDGIAVAGITYPDVPLDFSLNITNLGIIQVFMSTYNEPNITSANISMYISDNDGLFAFDKKKIYLPVDSAVTYSLQPGQLDNDNFELIGDGYTIQFKNMVDFETKSTYQIALTQTKDLISSTYIKTINIMDRDDNAKYYSIASLGKKLYTPTQVWHASGAALQSARYELAGSGEQNSALAFGGRNNNARLNITEKFNGSEWSLTENLSTSRGQLTGCGGQNSTVAFGGYDANGNYDLTEIFDGSVWQTSGAMSTAKYGIGGCGTQNAALAFGGRSSAGALNTNETFNGSSWTTLSAVLGESRYSLAGCGTQNAALSISGLGSSSTPRFKTEKFNGSAWSTVNSMYSPRYGHVGCGAQNAAVVFGGQTTTEYSGTSNSQFNLTTQIYNGDTWSAASPMLLSRKLLGGAGQQSASVAFGGLYDSYYFNSTEKFNGNNPYSNLESPTLVAANLNLIFDKDTNPNYLTNVFTLTGTANNFFEIKNGTELHLKPSVTPTSWSFYSSFLIDSVDALQRTSRNYFYVSFMDTPIGPTDFNWQPSTSPVPGTVQENKPANTFVGALIPTDKNGENSWNLFYYSIVGGDGMGKFYFYNQYHQGFLYTSQSFDYEAKSSYTLVVRCTDVSGYYFEKSIVITVLNVAD